MLKPLLLLLSIFILIQSAQAQIKEINRKVAQKNYEGYMQMQEHKYDSALVLFNQAIKSDAEAYFIYQNRAICKLYLKDTVGAIADYQTNIKLDSANAESKYALGNIYKHQKDSANALKYFIPAIRQADEEFSQKKLVYMNNFAGHFLRQHEDYDSALVYYNQVKKYTPNNSSVFINSAVCHFQMDDLSLFCQDLEQAFILGGNVNCIALKAYCKGCSHLIKERGGADTLSLALDTRLAGIIPDTIYYQAQRNTNFSIPEQNSKKVKVYYNKLWQMCLPEKASYYRESFWAKHINFFGGNFTDYYMNGEVYAKGRLERKKINGAYQVFYSNGKHKLKAQFAKGSPTGKWTYYLEDGSPDFEIQFTLDNFNFNILNKANTNYPINSGTGKFSILLDKWDKIEFLFSGEYFNGAREGVWTNKQDGQKIISEKYKKGKFKSGYVATNIGNIASKDTQIDAFIFTPPQITQTTGLYFASFEAADYYSFIQKHGF